MKIHIELPPELMRQIEHRWHELELGSRSETIRLALKEWCATPRRPKIPVPAVVNRDPVEKR